MTAERSTWFRSPLFLLLGSPLIALAFLFGAPFIWGGCYRGGCCGGQIQNQSPTPRGWKYYINTREFRAFMFVILWLILACLIIAPIVSLALYYRPANKTTPTNSSNITSSIISSITSNITFITSNITSNTTSNPTSDKFPFAALEAYCPFALMLVTVGICAVGEVYQWNLEMRNAEGMWAHAELCLKQGSVKAKALGVTNPYWFDWFDGVRMVQPFTKKAALQLILSFNSAPTEETLKEVTTKLNSYLAEFIVSDKPHHCGRLLHRGGSSLQITHANQAKMIYCYIPIDKTKFDDCETKLRTENLIPPKEAPTAGPLPNDLTDLGVQAISHRRLPPWSFTKSFHEHSQKQFFLGAIWGYYWSDCARGWICLFFIVIFSVFHALLPGIYRRWILKPPQAFFPSDNHSDKFIVSVYWIYSLVVLLGLGVVQAAMFHYIDLKKDLKAVIDLVNPKSAAHRGYAHFLPLETADNIAFWTLLRKNVKDKADQSINSVVASFLAMLVLLIGVCVLRLAVDRRPGFDDFYVLAFYEAGLMAVYLIALVITLVRLNTTVRMESLECLESARVKMAFTINELEIQLTYLKTKQKEDTETVVGSNNINQDIGKIGKIEAQLKELEGATKVSESSLSAMTNVDEPITLLGFTVDKSFLYQLVGVIVGALGSIIAFVQNYH